jgi:hypothetical protein
MFFTVQVFPEQDNCILADVMFFRGAEHIAQGRHYIWTLERLFQLVGSLDTIISCINQILAVQ